MEFFKRLSIRYKLMLIIVSISSMVLLLSSGLLIANELIFLRKMMEKELEVQTKITAMNIASPLYFGEGYQDEVNELLQACAENQHIIAAYAYLKNHPKPYGSYTRTNLENPPTAVELKMFGLQETPTYLQYVQTVSSPSGEEIGEILMRLELKPLTERIHWYLWTVFFILSLSLMLTFILSIYFQGIITKPILQLAQLTRRVSTQKNYSLRADSNHIDEIGSLFDGFNQMLEVIQERDSELEKHREQLENLVAIRTMDLKKANQKLTYQAYHDALTNLPNRALFIKRAKQAIEYAEYNNESLAILFIDLDNFKYINDTLGHAAGDHLLQEIGKRLLTCTRLPSDTIARLGGDEFTILLRDITDPTDAAMVADYIIKTLMTPLQFDQHEFYITPSIGISIYPQDGLDVGTLMKNADVGMYLAKKQGRNSYRFYVSSANLESAERLNMENKLRQALECNEFEVWYQPRFEIKTGRLLGAEALVRWRSPDFNLVSPSQFIPLAEDTGLIIPLGEWVLRTACEESLRWQRAGEYPLSVSVNLSARQFVQADLLSTIERVLGETGMNPHLLELELTESLIMPNAEDTIETLNALKKMGMQISVDDFGTGYSSLSYLKRFPIDTLKIDQSFVRDMDHDADDCALVSAIIAMAHNLKLGVVAEGVEKVEQLKFLQGYNCDCVQGFLFGKPMPADEFRLLLDNPISPLLLSGIV
jgi:diguanylate cyclase (GGDEF)-like protein